MENPSKMNDLGVPIFSETPLYRDQSMVGCYFMLVVGVGISPMY